MKPRKKHSSTNPTLVVGRWRKRLSDFEWVKNPPVAANKLK